MSKKLTTPAGINYGIWWLGWRQRGFWFHAFTLDRKRGICISAGLGLFAVGRGY